MIVEKKIKREQRQLRIFTKMKKYEWANEYRLLLNTERAYSEKHRHRHGS